MSPSIVVVGTSWGGLIALHKLLNGFPADLEVPVAIVQHRRAGSDELLSGLLQRHSALPVAEAEDKERIVPGRVYLAPADYHLLVEREHFALSIDPPVCYARPSIDVLFESAADAYGEDVIGVILTGGNQDGAAGLAAIQKRGGVVVVQDPATAESDAMPKAAIAATGTNQILTLEEIAPLIAGICERTPA